jgi:hypothetical protein
MATGRDLAEQLLHRAGDDGAAARAMQRAKMPVIARLSVPSDAHGILKAYN